METSTVKATASQVATYYVWNVWGKPKRYPVNDLAVMACALAGNEQMTPHTVKVLSDYGISTEEVIQPRNNKGENDGTA